MKSYHPSNIVPIPGLLLAVCLGVAGGAVTGVAVFFISKLVYLVLVFPVVMGVIAAFLATTSIRLGKIRNPLVGIGLGLLIAVVIYASMNAAAYFDFRSTIHQEITSEYGPQDAVEIDAYIEEELASITGQSGFAGFFILTAQEGVSIGRVGSSTDKGINLGEAGTYVYWLVEFLIIAGFALISGRKAAAEPFCETCERWYGKEKLLGMVPAEQKSLLLEAAQTGLYSHVGALVSETTGFPAVGIFTRSCENCTGAETFIAFNLLRPNNKGKIESKTLLQGTVTPFDLSSLSHSIPIHPAIAEGTGNI